jgi:hypothetical protein
LAAIFDELKDKRLTVNIGDQGFAVCLVDDAMYVQSIGKIQMVVSPIARGDSLLEAFQVALTVIRGIKVDHPI